MNTCSRLDPNADEPEELPHWRWPDRVQLVLRVDNMNTKVSRRKSVNAAAEARRDVLEIDVFDRGRSVRAKNRCNDSRLETADRTFVKFLKPFGPLRV